MCLANSLNKTKAFCKRATFFRLSAAVIITTRLTAAAAAAGCNKWTLRQRACYVCVSASRLKRGFHSTQRMQRTPKNT